MRTAANSKGLAINAKEWKTWTLHIVAKDDKNPAKERQIKIRQLKATVIPIHAEYGITPRKLLTGRKIYNKK